MQAVLILEDLIRPSREYEMTHVLPSSAIHLVNDNQCRYIVFLIDSFPGLQSWSDTVVDD